MPFFSGPRSWRDLPRLIVSATLLGYFGYALIEHYSDGLEETLKNALMIVVGYWLGSSRGSAEKDRRAAGEPVA